MAANEYWLKRLKRDRALADRAAAEVQAEVRQVLRGQYYQTVRQMESLYAEAQSRGELSRTKLWNYRKWLDQEKRLREFADDFSVFQEKKIRGVMDRVFEETIGASVDAFRQDKFLLPYDPRAVIDTAWSGEHYSARVWKNTGELARRIEAEAQQIVMGDKSLGDVKRQLMHDFDVAWSQADRLIDTEVSYVMNKANLLQYEKGYGFAKVAIICLDVNTCEKCKALEGEVFDIHDAPVVPIHPRCHCSYCVPAEGDGAEITASGANLDEVYARKGASAKRTEGRATGWPARNPSPAAGRGDGASGVKGYDKPKQYAPKGAKAAAQPIPASKLESKVAEALDAFEKPEVKLEKAEKAKAQAPAKIEATTAVSLPEPAPEPGAKTAKTLGNTAVSAISVLRESAESGIIEAGTWYERNIAGNPEMEAKYQAALEKAKSEGVIDGHIQMPIIPNDFDGYTFNFAHANGESKHNVTEADARSFVRDAVVMVERNNGSYWNYYGIYGSAYILAKHREIKTAFRPPYSPPIKKLLEVILSEL